MYTLEMHDRIRELRKNHLHLSQTEFGKRLGVSRSVINNIELNALARPDQKLSLIKLMCKEFSVSEKWLLNGTEPMFIKPDTFSLDQFVRDHGGTDLEIEIVKAYFELDKDVRLSAVNYFIDRLAAAKARADEKEQAAAASAADKEAAEIGPTVEYLEAQYKKTVLNSASKLDASALNTTDVTQHSKAVGD